MFITYFAPIRSKFRTFAYVCRVKQKQPHAMNTKHYDDIAIGEVLNGNTVTSKSTYVDRELIRDSGCDQSEATTYTLFFNGEIRRISQFKDSVSGYFFF